MRCSIILADLRRAPATFPTGSAPRSCLARRSRTCKPISYAYAFPDFRTRWLAPRIPDTARTTVRPIALGHSVAGATSSLTDCMCLPWATTVWLAPFARCAKAARWPQLSSATKCALTNVGCQSRHCATQAMAQPVPSTARTPGCADGRRAVSCRSFGAQGNHGYSRVRRVQRVLTGTHRRKAVSSSSFGSFSSHLVFMISTNWSDVT